MKRLKLLLFSVICLALSCLPKPVSVEYYVSAPGGTPCSEGTAVCNELSYYTNRSDTYFTSHSVFHFLEGNHMLSQNGFLRLADVENVTFTGEGETTQGNHYTVKKSSVLLTCLDSSSGLLFINSANITIRNITIKNCGSNLDDNVTQMLTQMGEETRKQRWKRSIMAVVFIEVNQIQLEHVSVLETKGYGLVTINAFGMTIEHCSFAYNNIDKYGYNCTSRRECIGGNALLVYTFPRVCDSFQIHRTMILNSNFSFGLDPTRYSQFVASGLAIFLEQMDAYGINHVIRNVVFYNNSGAQGANFRYTSARNVNYHTLMLDYVNSSHANEFYQMDRLSHNIYGAGLYIYIGRTLTNTMKECFNHSVPLHLPETTVKINNSLSSSNSGLYGSGLYIYCDDTTENRNVVVENCSFTNNMGLAGASILINQENELNYNFLLLQITVSNTRLSVFSNRNSRIQSIISSAILVRRSPNITFMDLHVLNNEFTGLFLLNTQATFYGEHVVFVNNTAVNGGGMQIHGDSSIILQPPVEIKFLNNVASGAGGGIFVNPSPFITVPCFFQPFDRTDSQNMLMDLGFINNNAKLGGSVVYGADVDSCYLTMFSRFSDPDRRRARVRGQEAFETVFDYVTESGQSLISSNPERICFCIDEIPDCSNRSMSVTILPGVFKNFSVVAVGVRNGTSPGIIHIEELEYGTGTFLRHMVHSSSINCSNVAYSVIVNGIMNRTLNFYIDQLNGAANLSIDVEIETCPIGFNLSVETSQCICTADIIQLNQNVICHPETATFMHNGGIWIGYDERTHCFITSSDCDFDYCVHRNVNFTIGTQDNQCMHSRSGIMCGQCSNEYSLMLGSNRCDKCSNNTLALIAVFGLSGIALILLLLWLNLTVSFGTINGLIFYANILKLNEAYFFPNDPVPPLGVFISWLNLDFGIPTCFSSGLNAALKTWLQLVFPLYLWLTVIIIALISHFSARISKLFGRNIIAVIATILLLSFTKLFRVCVLIWQVAYYTCNGRVQTVWAFDGNIDYWSPEHTPMVIIAIFVFAFLAVPYTLILFLSPLVEKYLSRFKIFSWWVKLKPFIDAYDGPYRDKYRYWTGLLLLVRLILVPVVALDPEFGIKLTVIVLAILLSIVAFTSGLYRHKALDRLEVWFILQAIIVASQSNGVTNTIGVISVSLVLATFLGVITFHILYRLNLAKKIEQWIINKWENRSEMSLGRSLSAYSHELIAKTQNARNYTSVRVNQNAIHLEDNVWVVNKRETLLKDS